MQVMSQRGASKMNKQDYIQLISNNIQRHGYHVYAITTNPKEFSYIYTIGLTEKFGFEMIMAGWIKLDVNSQSMIIKHIIENLTKEPKNFSQDYHGRHFILNNILLNQVESTLLVGLEQVSNFWMEDLMIGALDYYQDRPITAFHVKPLQEDFWLMTIPNMSNPIVDNNNSPLWQCYFNEERDVGEKCNFYVDECVLRGKPILEVINFDNINWQLLSYHSDNNDDNHPNIY